DRRWLSFFVALGSGFMLATALAEMLPESMQLSPKTAPLVVIAGYALVHFVEHALVPHFHFGEETHSEEFLHPAKSLKVLLGLVMPTFFEGIALASGVLVSPRQGWIVFSDVIMHKFLDGMNVASVI